MAKVRRTSTELERVLKSSGCIEKAAGQKGMQYALLRSRYDNRILNIGWGPTDKEAMFDLYNTFLQNLWSRCIQLSPRIPPNQ